MRKNIFTQTRINNILPIFPQQNRYEWPLSPKFLSFREVFYVRGDWNTCDWLWKTIIVFVRGKKRFSLATLVYLLTFFFQNVYPSLMYYCSASVKLMIFILMLSELRIVFKYNFQYSSIYSSTHWKKIAYVTIISIQGGSSTNTVKFWIQQLFWSNFEHWYIVV